MLKLNPYYTYENQEYKLVDKGIKTSESTTKTTGFQLQDIITFGRQKLTVGVDNQNINNEGRSFSKKDGKEVAPYNPNYKNNTLGAFAQANFKFFDEKLDLSAGARYDMIKLTLEANEFMKNAEKSENYNKFSPNLGLKYHFAPNSAFHASYGQAFLAPNAYQKAGQYTGLYGTTKGNPDLKGESSSTFDVGVSYNNFEQGVNVDITYFHSDHKDFIVTDQVNPDGVPYNGDEYSTFKNAREAKMRGLEIMASYDFGALVDYDFSLKAYMNGTFLFHSKISDNNVNADIKYVREKTINFGLHFMTENKWNVKLNGRFVGNRIEDNWYTWYPQVRPTLADLAKQTQADYEKQGLLKHPRFMVFDAHIFYNITKNITIGINANNILNENYTEKDGYNMPGRNFMAKVGYKF